MGSWEHQQSEPQVRCSSQPAQQEPWTDFSQFVMTVAAKRGREKHHKKKHQKDIHLIANTHMCNHFEFAITNNNV